MVPIKTYLLILIVLLNCTSIALSQNCSTCNKTPRVAMYDLDVQVAKPSDTGEAMFQWRQLFWLSKFAQSKLSEINRSCLRFVQPLSKNAEGKRILEVKEVTTPMLPSGSASGYADYLITGTVSYSGKDYIMHLELQAACSRQRIAFTDVTFNASSDPDYIMSIGHKAASQLSPLIDKINDFAKNQRESDRTVAYSNWGTESITIKPRKTKLAPGDETEVEVSMKDCDGYVLSNRQIVFTAGSIEGMPIKGTTGGTVTPSSVTTDANGKAKVKFKMGEGKAAAMIYAHYLFNKPSGCKDAMIGSAPINGIPIKVTVEYEMDQDIVVAPKMDLGAVKSEGGEEHSFFTRLYRTVFYHYPASDENVPENVMIYVNPEAPLKSTTIYESEDGFFFYMKDKKEMKSVTEFMGKKIYEEVVDEVQSETNYGRVKPSHGSQIAFYKQTEIDPMSFLIEFNFNNEDLDHQVGTGGFPGGITVSKNDPDSKFIINKINDPNGLYKTEYIIELKRSPGDAADVDKQLGTNFKGMFDDLGYKTKGNEYVRIRVLSPY